METDIDKIQRLIDGLAISEDATGNFQEPEPGTGEDSVQRLVREGRTFTSKLEALIATVNQVTESAILSRLESTATNDTDPPSTKPIFRFLFRKFEETIQAIIRQAVASINDTRIILWMIAEECYKEASTPTGSLYLDDYFVYNLNSHQPNQPRQSLTAYRSDWMDLWARLISKLPGGPTLFYPPLGVCSLRMELSAADILPYLFRTFDPNSSGTNNSEVVASAMSGTGLQQESRIDLLAQAPWRATRRLHKHLTKSLFGAEEEDNLVSWTSSLLFAMQYAIWRQQYSDPFDIKICAVDTTKFPPGQFASDSWLLESYREPARQLGQDWTDLLRLRNSRDYDNGEYLSQGTLHHGNRSDLVNLGQLQNAGLSELYPELGSAAGKTQWTNWVKELRQVHLAKEQLTSYEEVHLALQLGRCFNRSDPLNMALMFLAFRNRSFSLVADLDNPPEWAVKPVEVRRYWESTQVLKVLWDDYPHEWSSDGRALQAIYVRGHDS